MVAIDHHRIGDSSSVLPTRLLVINANDFAQHKVALRSGIWVTGFHLCCERARLTTLCCPEYPFDIHEPDTADKHISPPRERVVAFMPLVQRKRALEVLRRHDHV